MQDMSEKQKRKWERKQKRISHMLLKEIGVKTCEVSRFLVICNAGLVSGMQREEVVDLFSPFGVIENVVMLPGKSYSFVAFTNEDDSKKAFEAIHGKVKIQICDATLFLAYCERVPTDEPGRTKVTWPNGLIVLNDFVTEAEEDELLKCVEWEVDDDRQGRCLKHRRVKHYGYEFRYDNNNVDKDKPLSEDIPKQCSFFTERLLEKTGLKFVPNQLTVNEYQPGQGIPSHVDTHSAFEDTIASLSLGSSVVMEFRHDEEHACIPLPRRSLLVMTGESRYRWTHGITPRKMDVVSVTEEKDGEIKQYLSVRQRGTRTSFTFRRILCGECFCDFHKECDSFKLRTAKTSKDELNHISGDIDSSLSDELAARLESKHVRDVYEEIASHFSETRHKPWPNISKFVEELSAGSILLDVGCGNGKYFGINKEIFEVGCDQSAGLSAVANDRGFQVFTCNCLHLPLRPGAVDAVICIAVIHHLSTKERRLQALMKILEVLRSGGQALIYVWAKEQEWGKVKSTYLYQMGKKTTGESNSTPPLEHQIIPDLNISLPVHMNRTDFKHRDLLVPWKLNSKGDPEATPKNETRQTFLRFYHVFEEGELEALCCEVSGMKVRKSYYDQGNWCVLIEKE
ncbi:alkylated DNA repair protein alkB homolog 8 [Ischnura elegans]|uniref:alkylated DNA repair protein alkB homolog 8 n=1 Tax=Ischnura elegans TaxID=197161 RepID=UPI001ED8BDDC|nr:alkylated DNA repair protein alkB homolog 8 [Ischnura elegans]